MRGKWNLGLNAFFSQTPLSAFPQPKKGVVVFDSDVSVAEAALQLHQHGILSAPVRKSDSPADARWGEKYCGLVDVVRIVHFVVDEAAKATNQITSFADALNEMEIFKRTKLSEIVLTAKFGPLMPLEDTATLLEAMVILGKFHVHRVPVVHFDSGEIVNFLTQSAVVEAVSRACNQLAAESTAGSASSETASGSVTILDKIKSANVGDLWEGFSSDDVVKIHIDQPLLAALSLIVDEQVGGVAVVDETNKLLGNISASDVHHLIAEPFLFLRVTRAFMSVRDFLQWKRDNSAPHSTRPMVVCFRDDSLKDVMESMVKGRVHRVYVVDENEIVVGVVTLGDVIGALVNESDNHLEEFFSLNDERFRS